MSFKSLYKKIVMGLKIIGSFIVRVVKIYLANDLLIFAAGASFFLIISSIPLMMLMVSTISLLPMVDIEDFIYNVTLLFPHVSYVEYVVNYVIKIANELASSTVIYLNIITSLISGSTALLSFIVGIRKVHKIKHTSNYIAIKFMTIINIFVLYFTIIFTILFFVIGKVLLEYVDEYIPFVAGALRTIMEYKYLTVGVFITVLSLSLYFSCSNFKRKYFTNIYGAIFTAVSWFLIANLFSNYFEKAIVSQGVYQSIFGMIMLLIWLFISTNLVFIGACINEVIYEHIGSDNQKTNK